MWSISISRSALHLVGVNLLLDEILLFWGELPEFFLHGLALKLMFNRCSARSQGMPWTSEGFHDNTHVLVLRKKDQGRLDPRPEVRTNQ